MWNEICISFPVSLWDQDPNTASLDQVMFNKSRL